MFVKGIVTAGDAEQCIERGVDGIIVSNHGGRADDSGRGAMESLEEVAGAVRGRTPLFMDSGIRRGVDIFKALALGADAILLGGPMFTGLGVRSGWCRKGAGHSDRRVKDRDAVFGTPTLADIRPRVSGY